MFKPPHIYQWIDFLGLFDGHAAEITPHFSGYPAVICPAGVLRWFKISSPIHEEHGESSTYSHRGDRLYMFLSENLGEIHGNPSNFGRKHIMLFFPHISWPIFSQSHNHVSGCSYNRIDKEMRQKPEKWWLRWDISGGQHFEPDGHRFRGRCYA